MIEVLKPGDPVPSLAVETVRGGRWTLAETRPAALDFVVVYRGVFCPFCRAFVSRLAARRAALEERGFSPIAISMDDEARAAQALAEWNLGDLRVGHGLTLEAARAWGIYLTTRPQGDRTVTFCEPAIFLVAPDKRLYAALLQSIPCGRPDLDSLIEGLDFLAKQGFPARGAA